MNGSPAQRLHPDAPASSPESQIFAGFAFLLSAFYGKQFSFAFFKHLRVFRFHFQSPHEPFSNLAKHNRLSRRRFR